MAIPGIPIPQIAADLHMDRGFVGLDLFHSPPNLAPGMLTRADNVYVDGGDLVSRPGKQGKFATGLVNGLYGGIEFLPAVSGSTSTILFTSGGYLYKWSPGATAPNELYDGVGPHLSSSLVSANAFAARAGKYVYYVDGSNALLRTNATSGTGNTQFISNLTALTSAPSPVQGAHTTLISAATAANWRGFAAPSSTANLLTNGSFETSLTGWTTFGNDPDTHTAVAGIMTPQNDNGFTSTYALLLDDPGEGVKQTVNCPTVTNTNLSATQAARVYLFSGCFHQADPKGSSSVDVTITFLDASSNVLKVVQKNVSTPYNSSASAWTKVYLPISLTDSTVEPSTVVVQIAGGLGNNRGSNNSIWVDNCIFLALNTLLAASTPTGATPPLQATVTATGTVGGVSTDFTPYAGFAVGGQWLRRDFTGSPLTALANVQTMACAVSFPAAVGQPRVRFGFQPHTSPATTAITWGPVCTYSADGTYVYADLSTIPATTLASLDYVYFQILDDLPNNGPTAGYGTIVNLGPFTSAGNLSIGYGDYTYYFTEVDASTDLSSLLDVIETNPSPGSQPFTASGLYASTNTTIPAFTNTGIGSSNRYVFVYRAGGTFGDGYARLVAKFPAASNATDSQTPSLWSWTASTRVFFDNTPDSRLEIDTGSQGTIMTAGRDGPPTGAQAVGFWQNRLVLGKGSDLYISWLVTTSRSAATYFNTVNDPSDPQAIIKGGVYSVGGNDNDPIQNLVTMGPVLLIVKQRSIWMMTGNDPTQFTLQPFLLNTGLGDIAPRAVALVNGRLWFLAADGVYEFEGDTPVKRSVELQDVLNPSQSGGTALSASLYKLAWMQYHGMRLYMGLALDNTDTGNTVVYVYDLRQRGWTRFGDSTAREMTATGAVSMASVADTDDLYLLGSDGQLYQMTGTVDKATSGASGTGITVTIATRGYGQEGSDSAYWFANRAGRYHAQLQSNEAATLTLSATTPQGVTWSQPWTTQGAGQTENLRVKPSSDMRGVYLTAGLAVTVSTQFRLSAIGMETATGKPSTA